jgi:hypothetical protein
VVRKNTAVRRKCDLESVAEHPESIGERIICNMHPDPAMPDGCLPSTNSACSPDNSVAADFGQILTHHGSPLDQIGSLRY